MINNRRHEIKLLIFSTLLIIGGIFLSNAIYWNSLEFSRINDFLGFSDYFFPYSIMKFVVTCTMMVFVLFIFGCINSQSSISQQKWLVIISIPYFIIASTLGYLRAKDILQGNEVTYIRDTAITKEGREERIKSIQSPTSTSALTLYFSEDNKTLIVSPTVAPDNVYILGNIVTIHKFKETEPFGTQMYIPLN